MTKTIRFACVAAFLTFAALPAAAQATPSVSFLNVGSERERIFRVLQLLGDIPPYPWSTRQLSPAEMDKLKPVSVSAEALLPREAHVRSFGALRLQTVPVESQVIYNSRFPYGFNDGPIWAGRGLTAALSAGVAGRWGRLSFQLEPMVFEAQNQATPLTVGATKAQPLNEFYPLFIDLPQRFGAGPYRRFDPGQSTVRLDLGPMFADLSTADQWWGPAIDEPLILGDNAPGFLHASIGTASPVNIGIGYVHARAVWGRLEQSPFTLNQGSDTVRFMSGFVASFAPNAFPGLEIGAERFFHSPWPKNGILHAPFLRPFEGVLKQSLESTSNRSGFDLDNQLAAVFARWTLPASGVELYAEFGREDHNIDLRDLWQEPDHDAGYVVGVQRAWRRKPGAVFVFHGELLNSRISPLQQGRPQAPWYIHNTLTQGHTERGQLLGAVGGFGGAGSTVAFDALSASGRWTLKWDRISRSEARGSDGLSIPIKADVMHAIGVERALNIRGGTLSGGVRGVWDLQRDFIGDRFNVNVTAGYRADW